MYKYANVDLHQQIVSKIFGKNLDNISPIKRALLYANLIYYSIYLSVVIDNKFIEANIAASIDIVAESKQFN